MAVKCRFCKVALEDPTKEICDSEECKAFEEFGCKKKLECGHACPGTNMATACLPCLEDECVKKAEGKQKKGDLCVICYITGIEEEPCARLTSCGDIVHYRCLR